ncbi:MAG: hypothetical protein JNJ58_10095 [Chitinophagaceae bacterium]|nr:hypothetical protein [Chitinophagaceae bacterium]
MICDQHWRPVYITRGISATYDLLKWVKDSLYHDRAPAALIGGDAQRIDLLLRSLLPNRSPAAYHILIPFLYSNKQVLRTKRTLNALQGELQRSNTTFAYLGLYLLPGNHGLLPKPP